MMRSNVPALDFLAAVHHEGRGRSRPGAAARAIDFIRRTLGVPALAEDPRTSLITKAALRAAPHIPHGANRLPEVMVRAVSDTWGDSPIWWKRMVAHIMLAAVLTTLRTVEILSVPQQDVAWIIGLGETVNPRILPTNYEGARFVVPRSKVRQSTPHWVSMEKGRVTALLQQHLQFVRATVPQNFWLFPARKAVPGRRPRIWAPHPANPLSTSSLRVLMRQALVECCGISSAQAARFTPHSLRVAGINLYRRMGVPLSLRAQIAGHASIESNRRYLRLSGPEQLQQLRRYAP